MLVLLAKVWIWQVVSFFHKQGIIKRIGFPLKPDDVIMTCMNGKVNQSPLFDINVWCNKVTPNRQYSHLNIHMEQSIADHTHCLPPQPFVQKLTSFICPDSNGLAVRSRTSSVPCCHLDLIPPPYDKIPDGHGGTARVLNDFFSKCRGSVAF